MPRAWIVALGFVLAGVGGLGAYFLPVFQTAGSADDSFAVHSQIRLQNRPLTAGRALTPPELGCGEPALSPDGKTIAYLAPTSTGGAFQLWTVSSTGPASVRNITTDLGLDSTSAPAWLGG